MDTLLPLLYIAKDGNIQAAMSDAVGMLENAVGRFNLAANDLLEGSSGDQTVTTNVAKFIDSCRYACTANLNWR